MWNRYYYSDAGNGFKLPETPLEPLMMALNAKQKRFDVSKELSDTIYDAAIDALPQDRKRADEIVGGWRTKVDDLVAKYDGDYSQILPELNSLKRQIKNELSPGAQGAQIVTHKNLYGERLKAEQERLAKGEITQNQLENWNSYTLGTYQGVGDKDPLTGNFNYFQPDSISKYVDSYKSGEDIAKEMEPFVDGRKVTYTNGRYFITEGTETKELPASFIQQAVGNKLMQDVQWQNYMRQSVLHATGMEPTAQELEAYAFDSVGATIGQAFQRKDVKYERDMKNDSEYLLRLRRKWDKEDREEARPRFEIETAPAETMNSIFGKSINRAVDPGGIKVDQRKWEELSPEEQAKRQQEWRQGVDGIMNFSKSVNPDATFDAYTKLSTPKTEALVPFYNQMVTRVKNNTNYKTDKERNAALHREWNGWLDGNVATLGATDPILPKGYVDSKTQDQWKGLLLGQATKIFEIKNGRVQGSANEKIKQTKGKVTPLKFSAQSPELGIKFRDEDSGKEYVAVGASDRVTDELGDVQKLFSPAMTGETVSTRLSAGGGSELFVESSVGGTLDRPGLQLKFLEIRTGRDGKKQRIPRGEITDPRQASAWINDLMTERTQNIMQATDLSPNFIDYGDSKGLYDKRYVDQMDLIKQ